MTANLSKRGRALRLRALALAAVAVGLLWVFKAPLIDAVADVAFLPVATTRPAQYAVSTQHGVAMKTRDGVVLRADIHRPIGLVKAPTILARIPFTDTLWNRTRSDVISRFWAKRGYVVVVQGTRGRYRSDGEFTPMVHERQDGLDTLAWLARQSWWDGRLAMWGGSAFGQTQWAISDRTDPGVGAFAIQIASSRFQDFFHPGGAFALESSLYWALNSAGPRDQDVDLKALDRGERALPVSRADDVARSDTVFFDQWLTSAPGSPYWVAIDGHERASTAKAPALLLGGWYDPFLPGMLRDYKALSQNKHARDTRLVIGPFSHAREIDWPGQAKPVLYRRASVEQVIAWYDQVLGVGQRPTPQPRVRLYVMGPNFWRDEQEWPLARTRYTKLYLQANGRLGKAAPDIYAAEDRFTYDPRTPTPTRGGAMLGPRAGVAMQEPVGTRADVLNYVTPPLSNPLEITGPLKAKIWVTTDAPSTDFTAKLSFITPQGEAFNLGDGIIRRAFTPGERTPLEIDLGATSVVLEAGSKLRLDISSSNFPRFDRNPNTGESPATATRFATAHQKVWRSVDAASYIILPEIPKEDTKTQGLR